MRRDKFPINKVVIALVFENQILPNNISDKRIHAIPPKAIPITVIQA